MVKFSLAATLAGLLAIGAGMPAQADDTWTGLGTSTNWNDSGNWSNGLPSANYGTLFFNDVNNGQTTMTNDYLTFANQLNWSGTSAWILNQANATVLNLYDNGGTPAKVENASTGLVTINMGFNFAANNGTPNNPWGEINAINGDIVINSTVGLGTGGQVFGLRSYSAGHTVTVNGVLSETTTPHEYVAIVGGNMVYNAANTYTGDTFIFNGGSLQINAGANDDASAIRLGGDFGTTGAQDLTKGGTLFLGGAGSAGGVSVGSIINPVGFNTSNAMLINSQNVSGVNTLSGVIYLDDSLGTTVASGGTLSLNGNVSFQGVQNGGFGVSLTVDGDGSTLLNGTLTDVSNTASSLVKNGSGTLTVTADNTIVPSGSVAGTKDGSLLQWNLNGGTTSISSANNLGTPSGVDDPNKVLFGTATGTSTATLQTNGTFAYGASGTNSVGFAINQTSAVTGNTAVIEVTPGNTFTMNGPISDNGTGGTAGRLVKSGTGTLVLNAPSTYSGGTTVNGGTVTGATTSYSSGDVLVNAGATADYTQNAATTYTASITGSGSVTVGATTSGSNGTGGNITYAGVDSASGGTTVKSGTLTLSHTGGGALTGPATVATGGTVALGSSNQIQQASSDSLTLAGGTLAANGFSEGTPAVGATPAVAALGKLVLSGPADSTLDFGDASGSAQNTLAFADSSGLTWSGTVSLVNYTNGVDMLYVGNSSDLSADQLSRIHFSTLTASQLSTGQVVFNPAPEPSGWVSMLSGAGVLGGIIARRRRAARIVLTA